MKAQEIREKFKEFFESKGHTWIPSASLVPADDPSVLFTTAGMHPLVPYLLGEKHPGGKRVANVQKCVRTTDIDEVGDTTHLTFFEMLGNWSFGDYFKKEAIEWSFEFLTGEEWLNINPEYIYVSVFAGDDEVPRDTDAIEIWKKTFRLHTTNPVEAEFSEDIYDFSNQNRIFPYGRKENWWQAGEKGPAGPDTEMFIDTEGHLPEDQRVKHEKSGIKEPCHINCDCGRFVETWNDVFMQYNGLGGGKYEPLKQKNVDTGMGLERITTYMQGQSSVYDTELFKPAFDVILDQNSTLSDTEEVRARIIADHIRASVFIVADGVKPSNKERGYILRRLLRRAMVYGRLLGLSGNWMEKMLNKYVEVYKDAYPEVEKDKKRIFGVIKKEESKFSKTLEQGLKKAHELSDKEGCITGAEAFDLYQTYGFPIELTKELFDVKNLAEFEEEFKKHQEKSRTATEGTFKGGLAGHSDRIIQLHTTTHLMNAALRQVLGDHVYQKGSNINEERTRFDFTHGEKMTDEQIEEVEKLVNEWIKRDLKVKKEVMPEEEARELGAIGVFGEKYPDTVSIYTVYDPKTEKIVSREFCGGPHVENTKQIKGQFEIVKEKSSGAGVRRIKATLE